MPLVLTRREKSSIHINTPSGPVKVMVTQVQNNQVRIGIDCNREWEIIRVNPEGNIEKQFEDWKPESTSSEIKEYIKYALAQEGQHYGMEDTEVANAFRERKVFSILREALEKL